MHTHRRCQLEVATRKFVLLQEERDELQLENAQLWGKQRQLESDGHKADSEVTIYGHTEMIIRLQSFISQFEAAVTTWRTVVAHSQQQQQENVVLRQRVTQLQQQLALQQREQNRMKVREKMFLSRSSRVGGSAFNLGAQGEEEVPSKLNSLQLQLQDLQALKAEKEETAATTHAAIVDMQQALDRGQVLQQELLADLTHAASGQAQMSQELGEAQAHRARQEQRTGELHAQVLRAWHHVQALECEVRELQHAIGCARRTALHRFVGAIERAKSLAWNVEQLEGKLAAAEARQMSSNETASNKDARIITLERNAEVLTRSAADAKSERIEIESLVSGLRADLEAKDMAVVEASTLLEAERAGREAAERVLEETTANLQGELDTVKQELENMQHARTTAKHKLQSERLHSRALEERIEALEAEANARAIPR